MFFSEAKEGDVRISGAEGFEEGILEISHNGHWGLICYDSSTPKETPEAEVVCRQLGFSPNGATARGYSWYQRGPLAFSNASCVGNEAKLIQCSLKDAYSESCQNERFLWITCLREYSPFL